MSRVDRLSSRLIERLAVTPDELTVEWMDARAAPVAQIDQGPFHGRRYTDVGSHGLSLYEIVDDQCGSFINVWVA